MEWRPVVDWALYEVSDTGQVRRAVAGIGVGSGQGKAGRLLSQKRRGGDGRLEVCLYDGLGGRRSVKVHVLVAEAFLPPRPDAEHDVDHADRDCSNNAAGNLRWLHYSINRSSTRMDELYGPARVDWSDWESDGAVSL